MLDVRPAFGQGFGHGNNLITVSHLAGDIGIGFAPLAGANENE